MSKNIREKKAHTFDVGWCWEDPEAGDQEATDNQVQRHHSAITGTIYQMKIINNT